MLIRSTRKTAKASLSIVLSAILLTSCQKEVNEIPNEMTSSDNTTRSISNFSMTVTQPLGVWWWNQDQQYWDRYLSFADKNNVSEIYFSRTDFSATTRRFIEKAHSMGIKVFLLAGDYRWIQDHTALNTILKDYFVYQNSATEAQKFSGIHLDVEPHQYPDFQLRRAEILQQYIDFVVWVCSNYRQAVTIDFDIPFWFNDLVVYKGEIRKLYEAVISEANRVFIMSYRDTAEKMYDVSKDEMAFAALLAKRIFFGALTSKSAGGDLVSYYEEGASYMYNELNKLNTLANGINYGIAIHHIGSWYNLRK